MSLQQYHQSYQYDSGLNLLQQGCGNAQRERMIVSRQSNRAIDELLYHSLDLTPREKANPEQTFRDKGIFDTHGNQLKTATIDQLSWDYENGLQCTSSEKEDSTVLKEYSTYAVPGRRSRKVAETMSAERQIARIHEIIYLNSVEFHRIWIGANLRYDGKTVENNGEAIEPYEQYSLLRIREGHKQVARRKVSSHQPRLLTTDSEARTSYILSNSLDTCQLTLNEKGNLESYLDYRPFGETSVSVGDTPSQNLQFSGKEREQSGLLNFGFRTYAPGSLRWTSPDPMGMKGGSHNLYVYVNNNPVTLLDPDGREVKMRQILAALGYMSKYSAKFKAAFHNFVQQRKNENQNFNWAKDLFNTKARIRSTTASSDADKIKFDINYTPDFNITKTTKKKDLENNKDFITLIEQLAWEFGNHTSIRAGIPNFKKFLDMDIINHQKKGYLSEKKVENMSVAYAQVKLSREHDNIEGSAIYLQEITRNKKSNLDFTNSKVYEMMNNWLVFANESGNYPVYTEIFGNHINLRLTTIQNMNLFGNPATKEEIEREFYKSYNNQNPPRREESRYERYLKEQDEDSKKNDDNDSK